MATENAVREWFTLVNAANEVGIHPSTLRVVLQKRAELSIRQTRRGVGKTAQILIHREGVDQLKKIYPRIN